ncbi:MAG: ArsR family transcriptional regulator, partial [Halobacteriales archaeon]|nr:ArsR family transcriptional regulator [Halobacteriales archaeon]
EAIRGRGIALRCQRCGMGFTVGIGSLVLGHPAVVSFYQDHGMDLRRIPVWELEWFYGDTAEPLDDEDGIKLVIDVGDERLEVILSPDLTVDSTTRMPR